MPGDVLRLESHPPSEESEPVQLDINTLPGDDTEKPQLDIDASGKFVSIAYLYPSCLFKCPFPVASGSTRHFRERECVCVCVCVCVYFSLNRGFEIPLDIQDKTDLSIELAVLQKDTFNVAIAPSTTVLPPLLL